MWNETHVCIMEANTSKMVGVVNFYFSNFSLQRSLSLFNLLALPHLFCVAFWSEVNTIIHSSLVSAFQCIQKKNMEKKTTQKILYHSFRFVFFTSRFALFLLIPSLFFVFQFQPLTLLRAQWYTYRCCMCVEVEWCENKITWTIYFRDDKM